MEENNNIQSISWNQINNQINTDAYARTTSRLNKENDHISVYSNSIPVQCDKVSTSELHTIYLSHGNQTNEHGAHAYDVSADNELRTRKFTRYHRDDGTDMLNRLNLPTKYYIPEPIKRPVMTRDDKEYV